MSVLSPRLCSSATVSTDGLLPAPQVSVQGADFTIQGIQQGDVLVDLTTFQNCER